MSETFKQVKFSEQHKQRIDSETRVFKEGERVSLEENLARFIVTNVDGASYTDKEHVIEDADSKVVKSEVESAGGETGFDFDAFVENHTAEEIIEKVEETDTVSWLENLRNVNEYKTVEKAVDEKLDKLKE